MVLVAAPTPITVMVALGAEEVYTKVPIGSVGRVLVARFATVTDIVSVPIDVVVVGMSVAVKELAIESTLVEIVRDVPEIDPSNTSAVTTGQLVFIVAWRAPVAAVILKSLSPTGSHKKPPMSIAGVASTGGLAACKKLVCV